MFTAISSAKRCLSLKSAAGLLAFDGGDADASCVALFNTRMVTQLELRVEAS